MAGPDTPLFALGVLFNATGTVTTVATSPNIVGVGTLFTTELKVGDVLLIAGQTFNVFTITDNLHLAAIENALASAGGLSLAAYDLHTTLGGHGIWFPKHIFAPYSQPLDLGDGSLRGGGWPLAEWHWVNLPRVQRDALRALFDPSSLGLASAQLYVRTPVNDSADLFRTFLAQVIWPQTETKDAQRRIPFVLKFRAMIYMPLT